MKQYKVGDKVFVAKFGHRQVQIDCPVCFRKGFVRVILGNDEVVKMPCEYCNKGIGTNPTGSVYEWRWDPDVETIVISEVRRSETVDSIELEYRASNRLYHQKDMFDTHEEALAESKARAEKHNIEQETKAEFVKGKPDKNYSWNAGYHRREAKRHHARFEYHTKMAEICKSRQP